MSRINCSSPRIDSGPDCPAGKPQVPLLISILTVAGEPWAVDGNRRLAILVWNRPIRIDTNGDTNVQNGRTRLSGLSGPNDLSGPTGLNGQDDRCLLTGLNRPVGTIQGCTGISTVRARRFQAVDWWPGACWLAGQGRGGARFRCCLDWIRGCPGCDAPAAWPTIS